MIKKSELTKEYYKTGDVFQLYFLFTFIIKYGIIHLPSDRVKEK